MKTNTKLFAVAGNPVLHSKSPDMFRAAFRAHSIDAHYLRFAVSNAEEIAQTAKAMDLFGLNITSPYKEEVLPFLDDVEETARTIGAVNTIVLDKGRLLGFNTDTEGVKKALLMHDVAATGKKALILGAGGAARAAAFALAAEGAKVTILNRTFERAQNIARTLFCKVSPMENMARELEDTDILVSCLSTGAHVVPSSALRRGLVILEAHYSQETPLVREGRAKGCTIIDGREWLLFQGAAAFSRFTGQEPPVEAMRKTLYYDRFLSKRNIALIGFMGVGKSSVGQCLADKLNMPLIDIDGEIAAKNNASIEDIFKSHGEETFRRMEEKEVESIADISGRVISCGGGTVLNKNSVDRLREGALVIWLWAKPDTILQRIGNDGTRPLLNVHNKRAEIESILRVRIPYYANASDLFINTDGKEPGEIAERIYAENSTFIGS